MVQGSKKQNREIAPREEIGEIRFRLQTETGHMWPSSDELCWADACMIANVLFLLVR